MHPNFYHWHKEIKPDPSVLEKRWNAAAKFSERTNAKDICALLHLALTGEETQDFSNRYGAAITAAEPTFPPTHNSQLLRVMAAASLHAKMDQITDAATAVALGIRSANFPEGRITPVCSEVVDRANEYLHIVSERLRPTYELGLLTEAEKKCATNIAAVKEAAAAEQSTMAAAMEAFCKSLVAGIKESHGQIGKVMRSINEENQFLWWLTVRRSTLMNSDRSKITSEAYALCAAAEAAGRVAFLPPSESVEYIIEAVLSQCSETSKGEGTYAGMIGATDTALMQKANLASLGSTLTPLIDLLSASANGSRLSPADWKQRKLSPKDKLSPSAFAIQLFREMLFVDGTRTL